MDSSKVDSSKVDSTKVDSTKVDSAKVDRDQLSTSRQNLFEQLPVFTVLKQLLPLLQSYRFGVGGSLLLCELGLLEQARDLDLVCTSAEFEQVAAAIATLLQPRPVTPHPLYQSRRFARFAAQDGTEVDLMADIEVVDAGLHHRWWFDVSQLQFRHGIPWMSAQQWLELYQLFQRPQRVALLRQFLLGHDSVD